MPLQDLIGLCQTNATPIFLGSEIEFKNLVVHLLRNPRALILNLGHYDSVLAARRNGEHSPLGHGLDSVDDNVENGLFHQIGIDFDRQPEVGDLSLDGDSVLLSVGPGQLRDVFQQALLPKGELTFRGRRIDLRAIRRTALLTVEGERDDICGLGQTAAAHDLCTGLRPYRKRHHLQPGVGHYGVFSGRRWESQIYPIVRNMMLANE